MAQVVHRLSEYPSIAMQQGKLRVVNVHLVAVEGERDLVMKSNEVAARCRRDCNFKLAFCNTQDIGDLAFEILEEFRNAMHEVEHISLVV